MFCLGPPNMSYKVIFRWLLFVLGLVVPRRGQAVNQGQLLLVPDLGHSIPRLVAAYLRDFRKV